MRSFNPALSATGRQRHPGAGTEASLTWLLPHCSSQHVGDFGVGSSGRILPAVNNVSSVEDERASLLIPLL